MTESPGGRPVAAQVNEVSEPCESVATRSRGVAVTFVAVVWLPGSTTATPLCTAQVNATEPDCPAGSVAETVTV